MNSQQRSRWRTLAEAELARGNLLAPVVLDCLDELDGADNLVTGQSSTWAVPPIRTPTGSVTASSGDGPATFPAPAPSVDAQTLRHDLDPGPQDEEIETNLGPEPELGDHNRPFFRP